MSYWQLPLRLRTYIMASAVGAALAAGFAARGHHVRDGELFLGLLALGAFAGAMKVELPIRLGRMSLGAVVTFLALFTLGIPEAIAVNCMSAIAGSCVTRLGGVTRLKLTGVPLYRMVFNLANHALCAAAAGGAFYAAGGSSGRHHTHSAAAIALAAGTYYLVNTLGTAAAVAWSQGLRLLQVWRQNFLWTAPSYLACASGAAALSWVYQRSGFSSTLLMAPLFYVIYHSFRQYTDKVHQQKAHLNELHELNHSVITSLAMAIDAKDRYTHKHINRVREYAVGLAQRLDLSPEEVEAVKIAALLHDIGKLGVPENILSKPGKLTPEEFEIIKSHVTIGAMILEPVRFPWPVVPTVLSHHERWDGNGYPAGLKGEAIPIGGRVVSLADVFDALTSTRPYRTAMSREKAIEFLQAGSGSQFDPRVVETFIEALPEIEARISQLKLTDRGEESLEEGGPAARHGAGSISDDALEQIAKANDAMFALCELADLISARPDTAAVLELILQKVERLLPVSTAVVFLVDDNREELRPAAVHGLLPELFEEMAIKIGEGASGWVVEQNEPLLNGAASLDVARKLKPTENLELTSTLCVPLLVEGQVIGTITLYHTSYNQFKPHHQRLLTLIAEHAAPALEGARQFARTRQLAMEDTLTSLPNARALMQFLRHQLAESQRQESEFVVLLMDLDNFKLVNDGQGHLEGDRVLERVSRILKESVREMDFVARYAGDEFVVVLPRANPEAAAEIAQRIRRAVTHFAWSCGQPELGASIGQASYPADGTDARRLLGVADGRMYADKSARKKERSALDAPSARSDPPPAESEPPVAGPAA